MNDNTRDDNDPGSRAEYDREREPADPVVEAFRRAGATTIRVDALGSTDAT